MLISKTTTAPNGAVLDVHRLVEVTMSATAAVATVNGYAGAAGGMIGWQERYDAPSGLTFDQVAAWLVSSEGPLSGGTILADQTPLEQAQTVLWNKAKALRDQVRFGGCDVPGLGRIDTTVESLLFISGAVQEAAIQADGFSKDWTMADNSTLTFDAADMKAVGLAAAAHVNACQEASRATRSAIFAATSVEDLNAINIAAGLPLPPTPTFPIPENDHLTLPVAN